MCRRLFAVVVAASLVAGVAIRAGASSSSTATFDVTIPNTNAAQWFTPPAVATHSRSGIFNVHHPANIDIQETAENGNPTPPLDALEADRHADICCW